uniref:Uncharacterized protein n=1 Tax=Aplanochytrium stocchinoi TaxID=215587 RepID=A0A7S3PKL0_9STRA|mmetsp:Transcript_10155/g.12678  ORF Transcript_10155/g.12678 Transcript_10155/m.12678 type:complete len:308 (-) Transcript_10155:191-1114(-)|eukprot:CAMPEP_0204824666 /NCGR_PEP_ID=MMETSP1346-20131115/2658_1 /ASSEMBLY_ACC=CAM_ASM_000771 /TAXON_ID=215587 /ORGANISM="Aplanochytrium stocchinoi, Strain GSBS06" /LENGTH=307 /DNA_ID=CAMNT_0051951939 /DNA_START=528 /DNA_END=1451 /DNA_ORIENTATION=-
MGNKIPIPTIGFCCRNDEDEDLNLYANLNEQNVNVRSNLNNYPRGYSFSSSGSGSVSISHKDNFNGDTSHSPKDSTRTETVYDYDIEHDCRRNNKKSKSTRCSKSSNFGYDYKHREIIGDNGNNDSIVKTELENSRARKAKERRVSDIIAKPLPFHADTGEDIQEVIPPIDPNNKLKRTVSLKKKLSLLSMLDNNRGDKRNEIDRSFQWENHESEAIEVAKPVFRLPYIEEAAHDSDISDKDNNNNNMDAKFYVQENSKRLNSTLSDDLDICEHNDQVQVHAGRKLRMRAVIDQHVESLNAMTCSSY